MPFVVWRRGAIPMVGISASQATFFQRWYNRLVAWTRSWGWVCLDARLHPHARNKRLLLAPWLRKCAGGIGREGTIGVIMLGQVSSQEKKQLLDYGALSKRALIRLTPVYNLVLYLYIVLGLKFVFYRKDTSCLLAPLVVVMYLQENFSNRQATYY